jgi:hypothetical protein
MDRLKVDRKGEEHIQSQEVIEGTEIKNGEMETKSKGGESVYIAVSREGAKRQGPDR